MKSMVFQPIIYFGLCQTQNVLLGIGGVFAAEYMQEIKTCLCLVKGLFITGGIAVETANILLDQGGIFGVIFLFADNLFHDTASFHNGCQSIIRQKIGISKEEKEKEGLKSKNVQKNQFLRKIGTE